MMSSCNFQRAPSHDPRRCRSQDSAERAAESAFSLSPRDLLTPQSSLSAHFPHPPNVPRSPLSPRANPALRSQSCPIDQSDPVYAQHKALTRSASAAALPHSGVELSRRTGDFNRGASAAALPLPPLECASAQASAGSSPSADSMRGGACALQATRSYSSPLLSPADVSGNGSGSDGVGGSGGNAFEGQRGLRQSARTFDPSILPRLSQRRARSSFEAERPSLAENLGLSPMVVLIDGRPASPAFVLPPPPLAESPAVSAPNTPKLPNPAAVAATPRAFAMESPSQSATRPNPVQSTQQQQQSGRTALNVPVPASPLNRQIKVACEARPPTPRPPTPPGNVAIRS
ncbi:unnamed protein product [Closterium sp. NIES-54]